MVNIDLLRWEEMTLPEPIESIVYRWTQPLNQNHPMVSKTKFLLSNLSVDHYPSFPPIIECVDAEISVCPMCSKPIHESIIMEHWQVEHELGPRCGKDKLL